MNNVSFWLFMLLQPVFFPCDNLKEIFHKVPHFGWVFAIRTSMLREKDLLALEDKVLSKDKKYLLWIKILVNDKETCP